MRAPAPSEAAATFATAGWRRPAARSGSVSTSRTFIRCRATSSARTGRLSCRVLAMARQMSCNPILPWRSNRLVMMKGTKRPRRMSKQSAAFSSGGSVYITYMISVVTGACLEDSRGKEANLIDIAEVRMDAWTNASSRAIRERPVVRRHSPCCSSHRHARLRRLHCGHVARTRRRGGGPARADR